MKNSFATLPINPIWLTLITGLIAGVTINAIVAFEKELGWRGFLIQAFKKCIFSKYPSPLVSFGVFGMLH